MAAAVTLHSPPTLKSDHLVCTFPIIPSQAPNLRRVCHCHTFLDSSITTCRNYHRFSRITVNASCLQSIRGLELAKQHLIPTNNEELAAQNGCLFAGVDYCRRRIALAWLLLSNVLFVSDNKAVADVTDDNPGWSLNLESYFDKTEGFSVLKPVQWSKVDKAGATVLFEDPKSKANTLGVVVNPVRISSLSEFGTLDAVAGRLLKAERKKPSTTNVELVNVKERQVRGAVPLYQLEYKLDSTRGAKRIFSAVTVASKKLYILNIAFVDSPEKPLSPNVASVLDHIVDSFDLLN